MFDRTDETDLRRPVYFELQGELSTLFVVNVVIPLEYYIE